MNVFSMLAAAVAAAAVTGGAVVYFNHSSEPALPTTSADLEARLVDIDARLRELSERLVQIDRLQTSAPQRAATEPVAADAIEAAVAKYLGKAPAKPVVSPPASALDQQQAIAKANELAGDFEQLEAIWSEIQKSGHEEAVLAHLKSLADADPRSAKAQFEYGNALIASLQDKPVAKQGPAAMLADAAFDRALKADPTHWGARFTKATSLTFWPKITGKHIEAVKHFEVLMEQQEKGAPKPEYAQTYLFLGNMHAANGDREKAQAAYDRGLRWFPNSEELKQQRAGLNK